MTNEKNYTSTFLIKFVLLLLLFLFIFIPTFLITLRHLLNTLIRKYLCSIRNSVGIFPYCGKVSWLIKTFMEGIRNFLQHAIALLDVFGCAQFLIGQLLSHVHDTKNLFPTLNTIIFQWNLKRSNETTQDKAYKQ